MATENFPLSLELFSKIIGSREFHSSSLAKSTLNEALSIFQTAAVTAESFRTNPGEESSNKEDSHDFGPEVDETIQHFDGLYRQALDLNADHSAILSAVDQTIESVKDQSAYMLQDLDEKNYQNKKMPLISTLVADRQASTYTQYMDKPESQRYGQAKSYVSFRHEIWKVNQFTDDEPDINKLFSDYEEDDDLIEERTRESFKCPLTKRFYEDPVTSTVCHHSFSRAAILEVIRNQHQATVKCPIPACSKHFGARNLQPNKELAERAKRDQERELRETQARNVQIDIV